MGKAPGAERPPGGVGCAQGGSPQNSHSGPLGFIQVSHGRHHCSGVGGITFLQGHGMDINDVGKEMPSTAEVVQSLRGCEVHGQTSSSLARCHRKMLSPKSARFGTAYPPSRFLMLLPIVITNDEAEIQYEARFTNVCLPWALPSSAAPEAGHCHHSV